MCQRLLISKSYLVQTSAQDFSCCSLEQCGPLVPGRQAPGSVAMAPKQTRDLAEPAAIGDASGKWRRLAAADTQRRSAGPRSAGPFGHTRRAGSPQSHKRSWPWRTPLVYHCEHPAAIAQAIGASSSSSSLATATTGTPTIALAIGAASFRAPVQAKRTTHATESAALGVGGGADIAVETASSASSSVHADAETDPYL